MKTANILSAIGLAIFMMANTATACAKSNEPVRKPVHTAAPAPAHHSNHVAHKPAAKPAPTCSHHKPAAKPAPTCHHKAPAPGQHHASAPCHHKPAACNHHSCKAHKHHSCNAHKRAPAKQCCHNAHHNTCKVNHGHNHRGCL